MEVPHAGDATGEEVMEVMYPRCAGLDVHKETVVACVRIVEGGDVSRSVRTFATTTASLIELGEWLEVNGCTHVAMEATGVYRKPVWQVLVDSSLELVLANAAQVKNVPGRKSDVNDATWVSELLAHGLVRASFVPEPAIQQLRGLLRTRKQLVREKASHVQRLQKTSRRCGGVAARGRRAAGGHAGNRVPQQCVTRPVHALLSPHFTRA
jgi:transposase